MDNANNNDPFWRNYAENVGVPFAGALLTNRLYKNLEIVKKRKATLRLPYNDTDSDNGIDIDNENPPIFDNDGFPTLETFSQHIIPALLATSALISGGALLYNRYYPQPLNQAGVIEPIMEPIPHPIVESYTEPIIEPIIEHDTYPSPSADTAAYIVENVHQITNRNIARLPRDVADIIGSYVQTPHRENTRTISDDAHFYNTVVNSPPSQHSFLFNAELSRLEERDLQNNRRQNNKRGREEESDPNTPTNLNDELTSSRNERSRVDNELRKESNRTKRKRMQTSRSENAPKRAKHHTNDEL